MMKEKGYLGIDVGGTFIKAGFLIERRIVSQKTFKTKKSSIFEFMENLREVISYYRKEFEVLAIGIGVPGVFDASSCIMHSAVHIRVLDGKNLKEELNINEIPVYFDNDANFAGFGEYSFLSDEEREKIKNMLLITLGSGVGTGLIINGKLYRGKKGFIEGGHIIVEPDGEKCSCGNRGCLETVVSISGLLKTYKRIKGDSLDDTVEILKRARNGEKEAIKTYEIFGNYLGIGLATFNNLLNPEMIVLGGGLSYHNEFFLEKALSVLSQRSYTYKYSKPIVRLSKLGNMAGLYGASFYAKEMYENSKT